MRGIYLIIAAAALALVACGGEEGTTPNPSLATTPEECIAQVESAFEEYNEAGLKNQLTPDFVFYFNPADRGQIVNGYMIPTSWDRDEFVNACANMFNSAYDVDVAVNAIPDPPAGETTYEANGVPFHFLLLLTAETGLFTDGGWCDFEFSQDEAASVKYWRLTAWRDFTTASCGDGIWDASFGCILAAYR